MEKKALLIIGSVILAGGLLLASIGGHRIMTNLSVSEETALQEALRIMPGEGSLGESAEVEIWKSAQKALNGVRESKRTEGIVFVVSGIVSVLWGLVVLYGSRSTPKE